MNLKKDKQNMKKYERYQLVADFGEVCDDYEKYADAFKAYQICEDPKTLFGIKANGDFNVIFSK